MLLVTGAGGFLGRYVSLEAAASGRDVVGTIHKSGGSERAYPVETVDLTSAASASELIERVNPTMVVNCAAFTNVDECEKYPERAMLVNAEVPGRLAAACAERGVRFVHISTDSVFDGGRGGYAEDDSPAPLNSYARSKLAGEQAVQEVYPDALILRTNFIGLSESGASGLADWLATNLEAGNQVNGFTDVVFSPLLVDDLARLVLEAGDCAIGGIFHASARDSCSKYDFARRVAGALGHDAGLVNAARLADAELAAPRPLDTSLSPARLEGALGRPMPGVHDAITGYAANRAARHTLSKDGGSAWQS